MKIKTTRLFIIASIVLSIVIVYTYTNNTSNPELAIQNQEKRIFKSKNKKTDNKLYIDQEFDFQFQYPKNLSKISDNTYSINLRGDTISKEIRFLDKKSDVSLLITYRLSPNGIERYTYKRSLFNASKAPYDATSKSIYLNDGTIALVSNKVVTKNGKGHVLNTSKQVAIADFIHQKRNASIEVQYRFPAKTSRLMIQFDQVISSFEFNN